MSPDLIVGLILLVLFAVGFAILSLEQRYLIKQLKSGKKVEPVDIDPWP